MNPPDSRIPRLSSFNSLKAPNATTVAVSKGVLTERNVNSARTFINDLKPKVATNKDYSFAQSSSVSPNKKNTPQLLPAKKLRYEGTGPGAKRSFSSGIPVPSSTIKPLRKSTSLSFSQASTSGNGRMNIRAVSPNRSAGHIKNHISTSTSTSERGLRTPESKKKRPSPSSAQNPALLVRESHDDQVLRYKMQSPHYSEFYTIELEKKLELQKLNREYDLKKEELAELKRNVMIMQTNKQESEFKHQVLKDKVMEYKQKVALDLNELANMDKIAEFKMKELQQNFELEVQSLKLVKEKQMYEVQQHYGKLIHEVSYDKVEKMEKGKQELTEQLSGLQERLKNLDQELQTELKNKEEYYCNKQRELMAEFEAKKATLDKEMHDVENEFRNVKQEISRVEHDLKNNTIKESQINIQLAKYSHITEQLEASTVDLKKELEQLQQDLQDKDARIQYVQDYINDSKYQREKIHQMLVEEEQSRRILHNRLLDLKGNIRVFCRVRPPKTNEDPLEMEFPDELEEGSEIVLKNENQHKSLMGGNSSNNTAISGGANGNSSAKLISFSFDKVFQSTATNADIFEEISQLVQSALDGYNVCVFAYGQTGSGKTYTMSSKHDGMIPRAVNQIFQASEALKEKGWQYQITGQFLEIYNENINDLLGSPPSSAAPSAPTTPRAGSNNNNSSSSSSSRKKYEIRHDQAREKTTITNLTEVELTSPEMVDDILVTVNSNKSVAATKANEGSSRSHSIFRIIIRGTNSITGEPCEGLLNLIDLAGSERISHSQVTGHRLKETQAINKSLSCLGDVIYALGNGGKNSHVPFRNSKLTYLLQYSLSGNSKTLMFVNVSPEKQYFGETVNSLRFASKVNCTKVNRQRH